MKEKSGGLEFVIIIHMIAQENKWNNNASDEGKEKEDTHL